MEKIENAGWEYCQERSDLDRLEDILDFANMVFSMSHGGVDFASLLPKAYSPGRCEIPTHHMIRVGNKIRALIDTYPMVLRLQGKCVRTIRAAYAGTVSVHPNSRGKGYMIELMRRVEEDAREQGCALIILDGDRHRYQHYGFERAGVRYSFQIGTGNITHCCERIYDKICMASPAYSFEELGEESPCLDHLYGLYQRRLVTARSREDFLLCMQSYGATAYAILRGGEPVGYVNLSADVENVSEIELDDVRELPRVLYDLMMGFDMEQLGISVGIDETDKIGQLEQACDYCNAAMTHQIKILDYEAVFDFMLNWKQEYGTLVMSDYVVGVRDDQTDGVENYLLSVTEDGVSVSRTEEAADVTLGALELVRLLTTNLCYAEQQKGTGNKIKNAPSGWFPLPFYLPEADTF